MTPYIVTANCLFGRPLGSASPAGEPAGGRLATLVQQGGRNRLLVLAPGVYQLVSPASVHEGDDLSQQPQWVVALYRVRPLVTERLFRHFFLLQEKYEVGPNKWVAAVGAMLAVATAACGDIPAQLLVLSN